MTIYQKVNKSVVSNSDKNKILINQCESYMLTNINLLKCIQESNNIFDYSDVYVKKIINIDNKKGVNSNHVNKNKSLSQTSKVKTQKSEFALIKDKDTLFWCYYIIKYGYEDYEMLTQRFTVEKNLKIECINKIRKDKDVLKKYKLKRSEIESELLNDETITLKGFLTLCIYDNINFFLIDNRKYFELCVNDSVDSLKEFYNIIKCERGKYTVDISDSKEVIENKITTYRNSYYKI